MAASDDALVPTMPLLTYVLAYIMGQVWEGNIASERCFGVFESISKPPHPDKTVKLL
jgi:hypothetical protein